MGKKFIAKASKKKSHKRKFILFLLSFLISFAITYQYLEQLNFKVSDKVLVKFLLEQQNPYIKEKLGVLEKVKKLVSEPTFLLNQNYKGLIKLEKEVKKEEKKQKKDPLIYIYNSHQTEEYAPSSVAEYSVTPTVLDRKSVV